MKTYRNHRCSKQHRTPATFLRCALPTLAWCQGVGDYAVVAWCRVPTVTLWPTPTLADSALRELDALRCGGRCTGRHEVIKIDIGEEVNAWPIGPPTAGARPHDDGTARPSK